jgi:hypothetical protein
MCGCLLAAEEGCDLDDAAYGMKKLLLSEEEWRARDKRRDSGGGRGSGSGKQFKNHPNGGKDKDDVCGERPVQGQQMSSLRQESALAGQ